MLVSGGKILAIDKVNTNDTIIGDGVQNKLGVNTDLIATTSSVSSVSSLLEQQIDSVSSNFQYYYKKTETSAADQISAALQYLRDHEPVVSAGKNIKVVPVDVDGTIHYVVSASDIVPAVSISGRNGIKVVNENDTTWVEYSGTDGVIYSAGKNIDIYQVNGKWYISADVPDVSDFVTNEDISKLSATIASTYLSASEFETYSAGVDNRLTALESTAEHYTTNSAKYYSTYQTVYDNSAAWNEASAFSAASANFMISEKLESTDDGEISGYNGSAFYHPKAQEYSGDNGIKIDNFVISISADFLSANALDNLSARWESVYATVDTYSADWNAHSALSAAKLDASESANFMKIADLQSAPENTISGYGESAFYYPPFPEIPEYSGKDGIEVKNYEISISADYLSANALDDISGKWEDTYNTVSTASGSWNEASAFGANSGKFVTSAGVEFENDLAYFLKKQEDESVAWSGVDLSDLGKMYQISSLTPTLVSAGISADEEENPIYVISAAAPEQVATPSISGSKLSAWKETVDDTDYYKISGANIVGNDGISAEYDENTNQWNVGLSANNCYASYAISLTQQNETYVPNVYTQQYKVGNGINFDELSNRLTVDAGMWHVTIRAKIISTYIDANYYDTTLTCNSNSVSIQFDNSYDHEEYLSLDYDLLTQSDNVQIKPVITNVPANAYVTIERLQLHRVIAGYTVNAGGRSYYAGDGIDIQDDYINANVSSGLKIGNDNKIEVQPGSGVYIDPNNKLSIKLGKGLAFSADGDVVAIETDSDVNDVVETVETLKKELDGKLTTNMNVSDAQYIIDPLAGTDKTNVAGATLFTVPLQHNITSATQISFFTTDTLPSNTEYPFIFGLYEYNFDYFVTADDPEHNNVSARSQTKWVADTGPIWWDTPDEYRHTLSANKGKFTFTFNNVASAETSTVTGRDGTEYVNEFAPCMRSDRAYYLVFFARRKQNISNRLLGDHGYATGINETDPQISFRLESEENVPYVYPDETTATMNEAWYSNIRENNLNISLSGIPYWTTAYRHTNDVNGIGRPYVMIRNPRL